MSALAPYRDRRILFMLLLGFASGLPFPLLAGTLSAWMAAAGINLKTIGLFAWLLTPFNLKVLWAPILDRYRLPFGGRRRGWMAVFQLCLVFAIAALGQAANRAAGTVGAAGPVLATVVLSLVVATFAASQDVVSDAYRSDLLVGRELRARG